METFLAMLPEILPAAAEAGTAVATDAAATGLAETALADAALTTLPEAAAATIPEAATAALPEVATAAIPEAATAAAPEATGIMQVGSNTPGILSGSGVATPESIQAAELTADVPDAASTVTSATEGVSPYTPAGTDLSNLSTPGTDIASNQAATPDLRTFNGPSSTAAADTAGGYSAGPGSVFEQGWKSASDLFTKGTDWVEAHPKSAFAIGLGGAKLYDALNKNGLRPPEKYHGPLSKYHLAGNYQPAGATPIHYTPQYAAQGGIMRLAMGGPATTPQPGQMYPQSQQDHTQFAVPSQMPTSAEIINSGYEPQTNPYTGNQPLGMSAGGATSNKLLDLYNEQIKPVIKEAPTADTGVYTDTDADTATQDVLTAANTRRDKVEHMTSIRPFKAQSLTPGLDKQKQQLALAQQQAVQAASGGIMGYSLGGYAAGGRQPRLLKGPGDGMSDNIPATIADRQPARLADGEFVVPADVVSHLGNGSTDAGAKHLHKMMDQVRVARTGKKAQGTQINPNKYIPK